LNALRVFHTVVRHRSLRAAAEELRVSPQAVGQQIKILEDFLGQELFLRRGRTVEPNAQALILSHHVQAGFDELAYGVARVTKADQRRRINVNASPYFATRHLLDRMGRFRDRVPDADLRLTTMVDLPDFQADEVDVAIQWGFGGWGLDAVLLLPDHKEICCTPDLAARIKTPQDLLQVPLLHPVLAEALWSDILAHLGVTGPRPPGDARLSDAATMRRAALAGLGVGLLSRLDAAEDLALGKLVAPLGRDPMAGMAADKVPGFYLMCPRAHRRVPAIAAFCDWVMAEDWTG
jgi:LysR family glycine cleavage system transcriptional activator